MILYILIAFFIALLFWVLMGPVILYLDTKRNRYQLKLPGIISASLVPADGLFYFRIWLFFIPVKIDPLKIKGRKKNRVEKAVRRRKKTKKRSGNIKMIKGALQTIRIRRLELDVDTEDFLMNTWLVPVFTGINSENISLQVNYEGKSSLHLDLRTKISSLLLLLLKYR